MISEKAEEMINEEIEKVMSKKGERMMTMEIEDMMTEKVEKIIKEKMEAVANVEGTENSNSLTKLKNDQEMMKSRFLELLVVEIVVIRVHVHATDDYILLRSVI